MKKIRPWHIVLMTVTTLIMFALMAPANAGTYVSWGITQTDYNVQPPYDSIFNDTSEGTDIAVGLDLPPKWLTFEISMSDNGESTKTVGPDTYELDSMSMAFLFHGQWRVGSVGANAVGLHARYGYSVTSFEGRDITGGDSVTDTDIHPAYGLGVSVGLSPHWSVELDYLQRQHTATLMTTSTDIHMQQYQLKAVYTF